jgi:hypothetical protein
LAEASVLSASLVASWMHPLGLLAGFDADALGFLLGVLALLGDVVLRAVALSLRLVVRELEYLADPFADLLVGRLSGQALPRRGQFQPQPLDFVMRLGQQLLAVADRAARFGRPLVHRPAAVPAEPLHLEVTFVIKVCHQVCVVGHGDTQSEYGHSPSLPARGAAGTGRGSGLERPPQAARCWGSP